MGDSDECNPLLNSHHCLLKLSYYLYFVVLWQLGLSDSDAPLMGPVTSLTNIQRDKVWLPARHSLVLRHFTHQHQCLMPDWKKLAH